MMSRHCSNQSPNIESVYVPDTGLGHAPQLPDSVLMMDLDEFDLAVAPFDAGSNVEPSATDHKDVTPSTHGHAEHCSWHPEHSEWDSCPACAVSPSLEHGHVGRVLRGETGNMCHLVLIQPGTLEHIDVLWPIFTSEWARHFFPVAVYRVQNVDMHKRFTDKQSWETEAMLTTTPALDLWHGTPADEKGIEDMLLGGLDQRLSQRGYFGHGLYFSDSPGKASRYTAPRNDQGRLVALPDTHVRTLLRCKVLPGRQLKCDPNVTHPRLRREPVGYDSVKGNVTGSDEYVVYDNARVYAEYVVQYRFQTSLTTPCLSS